MVLFFSRRQTVYNSVRHTTGVGCIMAMSPFAKLLCNNVKLTTAECKVQTTEKPTADNHRRTNAQKTYCRL